MTGRPQIPLLWSPCSDKLQSWAVNPQKPFLAKSLLLGYFLTGRKWRHMPSQSCRHGLPLWVSGLTVSCLCFSLYCMVRIWGMCCVIPKQDSILWNEGDRKSSLTTENGALESISVAWVNGVSVLTFWTSYLKNTLGFKWLFVHEMTWGYFQCEDLLSPLLQLLAPSFSFSWWFYFDGS